MRIVFEYSDPGTRAIVLDGPVVHFVAEVSSSPYETDPLQSRETSPAQSGSGGSAGNSGEKESGTRQSSNGEQAPAAKSMPDDVSPLNHSSRRKMNCTNRIWRVFPGILEADILFTQANRSLTGKVTSSNQ